MSTMPTAMSNVHQPARTALLSFCSNVDCMRQSHAARAPLTARKAPS
jgi:hypothetical protein